MEALEEYNRSNYQYELKAHLNSHANSPGLISRERMGEVFISCHGLAFSFRAMFAIKDLSFIVPNQVYPIDERYSSR